MSIDDGVETSTRVFVSGLPPSLTTDQLRAHFAGKFTVTDAHVIPDRKIGFVGFGDHESAKSASKYFNRSFIRMSKISVELARPVDVKRSNNGQAAPVSSSTSNQARKNGGEYTNESRKRKRELEDEKGTRSVRAVLQGGKNKDHRDSSDQTTKTDEKATAPNNNTTDPVPTDSNEVPDQKSDGDWLRGRTSRLLDLMDTDELSGVVPDNGSAPDVIENSHAEVDEYEKGAEATEPADEEPIPDVANGRLFVRNLPFDISAEQLESAFSTYGRVTEIHIVKDTKLDKGKGLAFVQFLDPKDAGKALVNLDGKDFHGRLLHILPASDKKTQKLSDFEISKLPLKAQKALKRKTAASTATFSWNSLYMNLDAVMASVADRLGVSKSDMLDPTSSDAAVKQAHAETSIIIETKDYLRNQGVNVDAFKIGPRDQNTILLKNFPYGTTSEELMAMLEPLGTVSRFVLPPSGTMAIAQFSESYAATQALKQLAYRNVGGSVLYLEKAPAGIFTKESPEATKSSTADSDLFTIDPNPSTKGPRTTVFVRNLNFSTTSSRLTEVFKPLGGFLSARVKTRIDSKRPDEVLSMGFGFIEFESLRHAEAAMAAMNGHRLDGHELLVKLSTKTTDAAEERRNEDTAKKAATKRTKIIIKNLPFEASKKDIRNLFGTYGELRTVRMPRKFDQSTRGFAFAEFATAKEAENALQALSDTHLLGRRLVLDFAEADSVDPEEEIKAIEKKVGRQTDLIQLSKITGTSRKKFNVNGPAEDDLV